MRVIRFSLWITCATGAVLMWVSGTLGTLMGAVTFLSGFVGLIKAYCHRSDLIADLRREAGLMPLLCIVLLNLLAPRALAYSVTGVAPWCSFNSWSMLCYYYSQEECRRARPMRDMGWVCVPNPNSK